MLRKITIFVFALVGCLADSPTPPQGLYCSATPDEIYTCIDSPKVIVVGVSSKCSRAGQSECDQMKCVFSESGWLDGNIINKTKVADHYSEYAAEHPAWTPAVTHLKAACLGDHDLPAQGVFLNCPAYDIMQCALASFIKKATPSQWKNTEQCRFSRAYAEGCPVCPTDCFASQVPYGSCNACISLPRSA